MQSKILFFHQNIVKPNTDIGSQVATEEYLGVEVVARAIAPLAPFDAAITRIV